MIDTVSIETYRQVVWERDMATSQLAQAGVSLGEKADIVRVDRVLEIIDKWEKHLSNYTDGIYVQGQKMMAAHIRCDVLVLKGGEHAED